LLGVSSAQQLKHFPGVLRKSLRARHARTNFLSKLFWSNFQENRNSRTFSRDSRFFTQNSKFMFSKLKSIEKRKGKGEVKLRG
jgi:hypothetical protein